MTKRFYYSLPTRAWAAVIAIIILALLTTIGSGMLSWMSKDDAKAINTAGSIRMATFRINYQLATDFKYLGLTSNALLLPLSIEEPLLKNHKTIKNTRSNSVNSEKVIQLLITDMEYRLSNLQRYQNNNIFQDAKLLSELSTIQNQWIKKLKPQLQAKNTQAMYLLSSNFVVQVDNFVYNLQQRNETRQAHLQWLQAFALLMTIIIMLVGMYELRKKVLQPIEQLMSANRLFKEGGLETRVTISGYDEFKKLGTSFNEMASTIESNQLYLEKEILKKTQDLLKANRALTALFDFSKKIATQPITLDMLDTLIAQFGEILPNLSMTLCLRDDLVLFNQHKDSIALHQNGSQEICKSLECNNCSIKHESQTTIYPVKQQETQYGELLIQESKKIMPIESYNPMNKNNKQTQFSEIPVHQITNFIKTDKKIINSRAKEERELIKTLSSLISTALSLQKKRQQESQIVLMEERNTIARELHDSLAQSLSYLKIQISVLEKTLKSQAAEVQATPSNAQLEIIIKQIKEGLNSAYIQLRELLVTFRLKMNNNSFDEALLSASKEFSIKGGFEVNVTNRISSLNLDANEQIHLLQIAREALSNVQRHAKATLVEIELNYTSLNNYLVMTIKDNGIGLDKDFDEKQHHGIIIMQERAIHLEGSVSFAENTPTGTVVTIGFIPKFFTANNS